tara:strand:+ start:14991 stop:16484 length:1494 start_codon:yes stop_codon:yes gene_type:complete
MELSEFSRKYIEILDNASLKYDRLLWWSTLLGARNRFYDPTLELQKLILDPALGETSRKQPTFLRRLARLSDSVCLLLLALFKKMLLVGKSIPVADTEYYTIVKTHSYDHSFKNGQFIDPFLGALTEKIQSEKQAIVITEHLGHYFKSLPKIRTVNNVFNIYQFLKAKDLLWVLGIMLKNFFKRPQSSNNNILQLVDDNFRLEICSKWVAHNLILYRAFRNIFNSYQSKYIHTLYENTNWEKVLIWAKNGSSSTAKVIAHQHVPISESALNYFPGASEAKLVSPDFIITTGETPAMILRRNLPISGDRIKVGCGIRFHSREILKSSTSVKAILAALDGTSNARPVLNFLYENRKTIASHGWTVIVRFHPIFDLSQMKNFIKFDLCRDTNWEVSTKDLSSDLARSSLLAYWGSTVSFEAVSCGLPVVCVKGLSEILSNDPLWGVECLKWSVSEADDIDSILSHLESYDHAKNQRNSNPDLSQYFEEMTDQTLTRFFDL